MSDNNYPVGNTFSQRDLTKPYNQKIPRSMANSGQDLDEACPEIEKSSVPNLMDAHKSTIPEAEATRVINRRKI